MDKNYEEIQIILQNMGFSEREARVYLAILSLGKGTVTEISRVSNINRTTGYDILNSLLAKKLVSKSGKEPKQEYTAESPENLTKWYKQKLNDVEENIKKSGLIKHTLDLIHKKDNRPKILFYEGTDGLKKVYEDTLSSKEEIRAFASVDDMHKALPNYFPEYYKRRATRKINIRAIVPDTEVARERSLNDKDERRDTALVPPEKFYFSPEINIYDNKVMIASWKEKLGVVIESNEIADAMKKIYELAWSEAKRLDSEKNTGVKN